MDAFKDSGVIRTHGSAAESTGIGDVKCHDSQSNRAASPGHDGRETLVALAISCIMPIDAFKSFRDCYIIRLAEKCPVRVIAAYTTITTNLRPTPR